MSPIREWEAYYQRWQIGHYWDGTQWREGNDYVPYDPGVPATPPTYSPVGSWDFNDLNPAGWYKSNMFGEASEPYCTTATGNATLRQDQLDAGLWSNAKSSSPENTVQLPIGTAYRLHAAFNISRRSGSLPNTVTYRASVGDSILEVERPEGNSGWFEIITPWAYTQYDFSGFTASLETYCGSLDSNSLYTWDCDWVRIEGGDGNPLMYMSDPGDPGIPPTPEKEAWPLWWDGASWRR